MLTMRHGSTIGTAGRAPVIIPSRQTSFLRGVGVLARVVGCGVGLPPGRGLGDGWFRQVWSGVVRGTARVLGQGEGFRLVRLGAAGPSHLARVPDVPLR